jgi:5-methylcytosine-specific restriction enzyme A
MCMDAGRLTPASVVDHIRPHRGDLGLFWDRHNWQSLCKVHHDSSKQRAEARGVGAVGCAESGEPLDAGHHWNDGRGAEKV